MHLADIAQMNPKLNKSTAQEKSLASFVPMACVSEVSGAIISEEEREIEAVLKGFTYFQNGDILVAKITPCFENGKIALAHVKHEHAFGSTEFHVIRPDATKVDGRYLFHFLRQPRIRIEGEKRMTGSGGQRRVPKSFLEELEMPLPSLPEQRRIAAILDKAEDLRSKRREAIAKLDQLLQSVFLEMFGDPITNSKKFEIQELGIICDVRDGTHESPKYVDQGFPLVTSKNLNSGEVSLEGCSLISLEDYEKISKRSKVDKGDILMPMIGTIGNPVLVKNEPKFSIKNIALIKKKSKLILNTYILYLLKSNYFDFIVANKNRGGTQKFLSLGDIRKIPIPIPTLSEQEDFFEKQKTIEFIREKFILEEGNLRKLISSLQHQLFS